MSGGNCYIRNQTLYQQDCDSKNGYVISGYGFINRNNFSQCDYSITFKDMDGDV